METNLGSANNKALIIMRLISPISLLVVVQIACSVASGSNPHINPSPTPITHPISTIVHGDATSTPSDPVFMLSTSTVQPQLPDFPWPPPQPSAIAHFSARLSDLFATFGDIDWIITSALTNSGYNEKSYFGVPNGFAIVTRLEQIDEYGYPTHSNRWVSELTPISFSTFSLIDYLNALFNAPKGHYRVFVFIVTSDLVIQSGTPVSQDEAEAWVIEGANKLPHWINSLAYTKDHTSTVNVYEFIQSGFGEAANQNIPSNLSGQEHLERAGIWDTLEK